MSLYAVMGDGSGVTVDIIGGRVRVVLNRYSDDSPRPRTYRNTFSLEDSRAFLGTERKKDILDRLEEMAKDIEADGSPYGVAIQRYTEELRCLR